ncbi:O-antigen polymerase [Roseburia faecis]|uniref:O-antigen polymerase n=1 Tax=Roseburia faecis TaxID=301302 RepID=UPI003F976424
MGLFALILSIFLFVICILVFDNKPLHPATLFYGLYSFILFLSNMHLFNLFKASEEAYFLITIMLFSFALGSVRSFYPLLKIGGKKYKKRDLNIKIFMILTFINIMVLLKDVLMVISLAKSGVPIWQIRNWSLAEMGADNPIMNGRSFLEELVRALVLAPFGMAIPPIASYIFFDSVDRKYKVKIVTLVILQVVLTSIAGGGGRLRFVYACGCFVIAYLMFSNKKLLKNFSKKKYKKYMLLIAIGALIGIGITTIARVGNGTLLKQIYKYFALPPTLLTVWLPEIEKSTKTCGFLTFYGVVGYFFRTLKTLGLDFLVPSIYNEAFNHLLKIQEFRNVGLGTANAFVTPVYYMMVDGGIPFLCFVTLVLSSLAASYHKRLKKNIDICNFSIYAMIMYGVFETFMNVMTAVPAQIITFLLIIILCSKRKEN